MTAVQWLSQPAIRQVLQRQREDDAKEIQKGHPCTRSGCGNDAPLKEITQGGLAVFVCPCGNWITTRVEPNE